MHCSLSPATDESREGYIPCFKEGKSCFQDYEVLNLQLMIQHDEENAFGNPSQADYKTLLNI